MSTAEGIGGLGKLRKEAKGSSCEGGWINAAAPVMHVEEWFASLFYQSRASFFLYLVSNIKDFFNLLC